MFDSLLSEALAKASLKFENPRQKNKLGPSIKMQL
jgi:hypothetical protein